MIIKLEERVDKKDFIGKYEPILMIISLVISGLIEFKFNIHMGNIFVSILFLFYCIRYYLGEYIIEVKK